MAGDGEDPPFELDLLTPKYEPSHHSLYLRLLRRALEAPNVRNIALTGAYGTGKSSVLTQLMEDNGRRKRTLVISLSSLGLDYSTTRQGTGTAEGARTNQIQKEIVKQILYTVHPGRAPRSRFDRTSRDRALDGLVLAVLVGLVAAVAITYGRSLIEGVVHGTANPVLTFTVSLLAVASFVYLLRRVMRGRVSLEQLEAGPASISLKSFSTSFFDEFLDEIVYFFEVTKRDLVIFEDIDRFDDAGIFETLRALNTLLNSAPQLRRKPVRFIYAMRDSVFQKLERQLEQQSETDDQTTEVTPPLRSSSRGASGDVDVARDDVERANRTKFFDLVIPVVPFISRENARDIMTKQFRKDAMGVTDRLLNIVARHIADMRLVTNIRNEFKVFHHHLIDGPHRVPGLDSDRLLAIVVYKNVHLEDFEKIRLGTSNLDTLYAFGRNLVTDQVKRDTELAGTLRSAIADQDAVTWRAEQLGDRLSAVLQDIGYIHGPSGRLSAAGLRAAQFWQNVAGGAAQYTLQTPNGGMPATRLLLEALVHQSLTPERWDSETRPAIERQIMSLDHAITDAIRADWAALYRAADDERSGGETFAAASRRLLRSDLAADLVEHGYLDEYFSLYIAPFYGEQISRRARSFIQQHVDRGVPDELYLLDGPDVAAILRDRPHALDDVGIYNVSVLDHLLAHNRDGAATIIGNVPRMGAEQANLLLMYVEHGAHPTAFVEFLTPIWPAVFAYLAEDAHVDQSRLLSMVDAALRSWATEVDYTLNASVRELLEEHYVLLPSLSGPQSTGHAAELAIRCGATFFDLTPIGDGALPTVRDADAYPITAPNLRRVTGMSELSLDHIAALDPPTVYTYVQSRLQDYLDATDDQPSVLEPARFGEILSTLDGQQPALLDRVVARSAAGCVIADIAKVPQTAWAALASHAKFTPTVANLHAYISAKFVDLPLATLLDEAGPIVAADDPSIWLSVQAALVNAHDAIPDPERRVELADQIPTEEYLDPDQIPHERSNIVSLLLGHNLVEDGASTFAPEVFVDGATFAQAVAVSEQFATFMTPALVPGDRIADVIGHERVGVAVKMAVLEGLGTYAADAPPAAFRAIAKYARDAGMPLSEAQMANLHAGGVDDRAIVALIARSDLTRDDLLKVLSSLEEYAEVAQPGRTKVKLPDDNDHWALVHRLEDAGIVSKASSDGDGSIEVWRYHKAR